MPKQVFPYDVFLSHNRAQKEWTQKLAVSRDEKGIKVWLDECCISTGTW